MKILMFHAPRPFAQHSSQKERNDRHLLTYCALDSGKQNKEGTDLALKRLMVHQGKEGKNRGCRSPGERSSSLILRSEELSWRTGCLL